MLNENIKALILKIYSPLFKNFSFHMKKLQVSHGFLSIPFQFHKMSSNKPTFPQPPRRVFLRLQLLGSTSWGPSLKVKALVGFQH